MPDIDFGQLSEALNDKMDRDAHNVQSPSAVVIAKQDPTSENDYTWYRKYSDGWVEQGGNISVTFSSAEYYGTSLSLHVAMKDTNYYSMITSMGDIPNVQWIFLSLRPSTTTKCTLAGVTRAGSVSGTVGALRWIVCGYMAS